MVSASAEVEAAPQGGLAEQSPCKSACASWPGAFARVRIYRNLATARKASETRCK